MTETAADRARQERAAQGLPRIVTDPAALARIATLVRKAGQATATKERAA